MKDRFPRSVYGRGTEPDPRFSLANERTFLAWVRTALALFAAGVALEALQVPVRTGFRATAALLFVALGFLASVQGWRGWARTERSMREGRAIAGPATGLALVVGICAAMLLLVVGFTA